MCGGETRRGEVRGDWAIVGGAIDPQAGPDDQVALQDTLEHILKALPDDELREIWRSVVPWQLVENSRVGVMVAKAKPALNEWRGISPQAMEVAMNHPSLLERPALEQLTW